MVSEPEAGISPDPVIETGCESDGPNPDTYVKLLIDKGVADKLELTEDTGVTLAHVVPALISSISAFGVFDPFLIQIDAKVVLPDDVPLEFETPPVGSTPPSDAGFTHSVATSFDVPLKSYLTTTRYVAPNARSLAYSVCVTVPVVVF